MEGSSDKIHIPITLYFSVISSILLILINIFRWYLTEIFTVFLLPILELSIILMFLVSMILNVIYIVRHIQKERLRAIIPFTISVVTILIVWFVPFTNIILEWDFNMNLKDREKVVSMIKTDELVSNVS